MKSKLNKYAGLLGGISAIALVQACGGVAMAQQAAAPAALDTVVVTARKTSENIVRTPVAITAVSAASLENKGVNNIITLQDFTPGFRVVNQTFSRNDRGYSTYVMRGLYGGDTQQRQPVRVFIDGVPIASGMVAGVAGVDRVEVVAGPQSAYFGRSTFAGAVNFITRTPGNVLAGDVSADFGSYGYQEFKGSVEGPIIQDKLSGRLSGRYYSYDGSYKNQGGPGNLGAQETKSIAGTLYAKPIENLKIKVFGQYWEDHDGNPSQGVLVPAFYNCNPAGGAIKTYTCGSIKSVPGSTLYVRDTFPSAIRDSLTASNIVTNLDNSYFDNSTGLQRKAWQGFTSFEYNLPANWTLTGNAGSGDNQFLITIDGFQQPAPSDFILDTPQHMKDFSGELRLSSPMFFDRVKFSGGVNYLDTSVVAIAAGRRGTAAVTNLTDPSHYYSRTFGVFATMHVDVTDKLKFDLEGRNQQDEITQKILPNANSLVGVQQIVAHRTFTTFTPKAILSYQMTPEVMVYGSYSRGSRPGSFNTGVFALSPANRTALLAQTNVQLAVEPEKLDMYEFGLKGEFLDRRLRVLADTYYGNWTDRQVTASIFYFPPGATTSIFVNAISGSSTVHLYGVEGKAEFVVTPDLSVEGTFAFNESDIRSTFCAACLTLTGNSNPVGNRLPAYPAVTGSVSVNYGRDLGNDLRGNIGVDYIYTGKQFDSEANLAWTPAANRVNLRAGLTRDKYGLEFYGVNVFNNKTPTSLFRSANALSGGSVVIASPPEKPRFGVRLTAKF